MYFLNNCRLTTEYIIESLGRFLLWGKTLLYVFWLLLVFFPRDNENLPKVKGQVQDLDFDFSFLWD